MFKKNTLSIALALGAVSLAVLPVANATSSPFTVQHNSYNVADNSTPAAKDTSAAKDASTAKSAAADKKAHAAKHHEGKCGKQHNKKHEGKCSKHKQAAAKTSAADASKTADHAEAPAAK